MARTKKRKFMKNSNILPLRKSKLAASRLPIEESRGSGEDGPREDFLCMDDGRVQHIARVLGQMLNGLRTLKK